MNLCNRIETKPEQYAVRLSSPSDTNRLANQRSDCRSPKRTLSTIAGKLFSPAYTAPVSELAAACSQASSPATPYKRLRSASHSVQTAQINSPSERRSRPSSPLNNSPLLRKVPRAKAPTINAEVAASDGHFISSRRRPKRARKPICSRHHNYQHLSIDQFATNANTALVATNFPEQTHDSEEAPAGADDDILGFVDEVLPDLFTKCGSVISAPGIDYWSSTRK